MPVAANNISPTEMSNILNASSAIIAALFDQSKLKMTVSCLSIDANGTSTVKWSETQERHEAHEPRSTVRFPARAGAVPDRS